MRGGVDEDDVEEDDDDDEEESSFGEMILFFVTATTSRGFLRWRSFLFPIKNSMSCLLRTNFSGYLLTLE